MAKIEPAGNAHAPTRTNDVEAMAVEGLACQRGGRVVVSGLSFEVRAGNALAVRGPNGSGKTTLLRTIAGFLPPVEGTIRIVRSTSGAPHSLSVPTGREAARTPVPLGEGDEAVSPSRLREGRVAGPSSAGQRHREDSDSGSSGDGVYHYIGHANGIKPRLSVIENVSFWQRYYSGTVDVETAEAALDAFALLNLASFSAGHLSQGQARRLGLARLLSADRPIWLLDEPSVSLDAASTKLLEGAITGHLSSGGLALISTHLDLSLSRTAVLELGVARVLQ